MVEYAGMHVFGCSFSLAGSSLYALLVLMTRGVCVLCLQVLLKECVAPHMADLGATSSAIHGGPAAQVGKMFR